MQRFSDVCPNPRKGIVASLRQISKASYLGLKSRTFRPRPGEKALRCFNSHYVFDDQVDSFDTMIRMLQNLGQFVKTSEMVDMVEGKVAVDGRYFHLSFDDGLQCLGRNAAPVLDSLNVPALVFMNSAFAQAAEDDPTQGGWTEISNYRQPIRVMNWGELKETNFEIGAHTRTHKRLSTITSEAELDREIADCKREIETALGISCDYFAWPFGTLSDLNETAIERIQAAGFRAAFGSFRSPIVPAQTNLLKIPRHHFEPQWSNRNLELMATGGFERSTRNTASY